MNFFKAVGLIVLLFLGIGAHAQSIQIQQREIIRLGTPVAWTDPTEGGSRLLDSTRLLAGGDWLVLSSKVVLPNPNGGSNQTMLSFERRLTDGSQKWRVDRMFTNAWGDETQVIGFGVSDKGEIRMLLHARFGTELWSATTDGLLYQEGREFQSLWNSIYVNGDNFVLSAPKFRQGQLTSEREFYLRSIETGIPVSYRNLSFYEGSPIGGKIEWADRNSVFFFRNFQLVRFDFTSPQQWSVDPIQITRLNGGPLSPGFSGDKVVRVDSAIVVGGSISTGGGANPYSDVSQAFGKSDAWIGWLDEKGTRFRDRTFGGIGDDALSGFVPMSDGGMILAIKSMGSGISGNKSIDGDGLWLVRISKSGTILSQTLIPNQDFLAMESKEGSTWVLTRTGNQVFSTKVETEASVVVSLSGQAAFDLQISDDLVTWKSVGNGLSGDVVLTQPVDRGSRFYRLIPNATSR